MKKLLLLAATLMLASCASLLPKGDPAPRLFTLNAPQVQGQGPVAQNLQILLPEANPGIDTDRIVLRNTDNGVDFYKGAKWTTTLPALLQAMFVEGFDRNGQLASVGSDLVVMKDGYQLLVEVRDFQAEYIRGSDGPRAHVRLTAKLLHSGSNAIIRTQAYDRAVPAAANTLKDVVAALDAAFQQASGDIIRDTIEALRAERPTNRSR